MSDIDRTLEQLLGNASPRAVPDANNVAAAREAVRAEWLAITGKRQARRNVLRYAVAATVLLGIFSFYASVQAPLVSEVQVASVQKSHGSIYVRGSGSTLTLVNELAAIHHGQTVITGSSSGVALAWGDAGSLRLDENTEIETIDSNTVFLKLGQIYFDSTPSELTAGITSAGVTEFEINTDYGVVSHIGTQFITSVDNGELAISVREGMVDINVDVATQKYSYVANRGEHVRIVANDRPVVLSVPVYGEAWDWVSQLSPAINVDGKSAHDFLLWAGRELGREVEFADALTMQETKNAEFRGEIHQPPVDALSLRMATLGIDWELGEGKIYVGK